MSTLHRTMANSVAERAASEDKSDHFDTPAYAVEPLLKYIDPQWKVWECTDTYGRSQIASTLRAHGCNVLSTGKEQIDFCKTPITETGYMGVPDLIITNPPYNIKDDFIGSCIYYEQNYGTKWALLLPLFTLEGIKRHRLFTKEMRNPLSLLVLDRRVEFLGKSVWFNTSWFTSGLLPERLMFAELKGGRGSKCQ